MTADKPQERIAADVVLIAVGQGVETEPFEEFGMATVRGCFDADEGLAAAGLWQRVRGRRLPDRAGHGHPRHRGGQGGRAQHRCVPGLPRTSWPAGSRRPPAPPNDRTPKGRVELVERPARERKRDFKDVECGMSREEAEQECGRCLRCDVFGCGAAEEGREQYA